MLFERIAFFASAVKIKGGPWVGFGAIRAGFEQVAAAVEREAGRSTAKRLEEPREYERIDRIQPMLFALGSP